MELSLDDLIGKCDICGGTGKKPQELLPGGGSFGRRVITSAPLGADPEDCGGCAGSGRRGLTDAGRAVLDFLDAAQKLKGRGQLD